MTRSYRQAWRWRHIYLLLVLAVQVGFMFGILAAARMPYVLDSLR